MAHRAVTTDFAPAIRNSLANPTTPSLLIFPRAVWQALRTTMSAVTFSLETSSTVRQLGFLVASVTLIELEEIHNVTFLVAHIHDHIKSEQLIATPILTTHLY